MNKVRSWKSLQQTLGAELENFHQLFAILSEENLMLRHMDHDGLSKLAKRKEEILSLALPLEEKRAALMSPLLGVDESSNPMDVVRALADQGSPEAHAVRAELEAVLEVGRNIAVASRENALLIHKGLTMVREALRLIYDGAGVTPVYGEKGTLQFPATNSSLSVRG